jgi:hypothetical protein
MSVGQIDIAVVLDGKLVITISDDTFLILTLDQLLGLGIARHPITESLRNVFRSLEQK